MIRLFNSTATEFSTLGIGNLTDATLATVVEERNGSFELELQYPIDGIHYSDIKLRSLIVCKPNPYDDPQAFRVYYISKPINGIVTINAEHISYDMSGIVVSPFTAPNIQATFDGLKSNSTPSCPFGFITDKNVDANFNLKIPSTLRSLLGGTEGSILDVYGTGEYTFNNYSVSFKTHRGMNRGVTLRYGKNITDLTQEENNTKVYTAVYPFWSGIKYEDDTSTDVLVTLPEKIVNVDGTFDYVRILPIDLSDRFDTDVIPTASQLMEEAKKYISQNEIGKPDISIKVSFVQLEQTEEFEQLRLLESVYLCDEVTVIFEKLGVNATAKCIKTEYNAITNKYESLEFGNSRTNLASTIVNQAEEIANTPTTTVMEQAITRVTKELTGGLGGYVILHSSSGQKTPDEILILDENSQGDYTKATKIWRWNKNGLGYSKNGYEGPFETAITQAGEIVASFITAGTLTADRVRGGMFQIGGPTRNPDGTVNPGADGTIYIKDASGNNLVWFDKTGMHLAPGQTISWANVAHPTIPTDVNQLTDASGQKWSTTVGNTWLETADVICQNLQVYKIKDNNTEEGRKQAEINLTSSTGTKLLFGTAAGYSNGCNIMISGSETSGAGDDGFGVMAKENHGTETNPERSGLWHHHHSLDYYWYDYYYGTGFKGRYRTINFREGTIESHPSAISENGQWRFATISDKRLKENIQDISVEVIRELFSRIEYKTFNLKCDTRENKKIHYGLIAQEVKEIFKSLGIETDEYLGKGSLQDYYYLVYENITRFCIPAVKDLYEICEKQQTEIDILKQQIEELRKEIK